MSRMKRPSFLPLTTNSYDRSEYYIVPDYKPNYRSSYANNIYSPTNSLDSEYSPANTPTTPWTPNNAKPPTPKEYYLPYSKAPIGSTVPISSFDSTLNDNPFRARNAHYAASTTYNNNNSKPIKLATSNNSTRSFGETPDWFDASVNMDEPFKFYESTNSNDESSGDDEDDETGELNRTLTSHEFGDNANRHRPIGSATNYQQPNGYQFRDQSNNNALNEQAGRNMAESDDDETDDDNCPIKFQQLMDLAESTFIKCIHKTAEKSKSNQSSYPGSNVPPVLIKFCKFCKNNREPRYYYLSHSTMDSNGEITCPILQNYQCTLCGSKGKQAHTRSYCPYSKLIRETMPDINDTYEFYNKKSMIHSTDAHLFDNDANDELSDV